MKRRAAGLVVIGLLAGAAAAETGSTGEVAALKAELAEMSRQVEELTVALAEARMELDRLKLGGATERPAGGAAASLRAAEIAVRDVNRGLSLVVLDAGASAGLRPGMVFALVRSEEVIARVKTVDVRERIAGARIEDLPRGVYPEPGDRAVIWRSMTE